jgi:hypothetical protein
VQRALFSTRMPRAPIAVSAAALALLLPATAEAKPRASVKLTDCTTSDAPEGRSATFKGRMRRVRGTERMKMRFKLLERIGKRFTSVDAPELRVWRKSREGKRVFSYDQRVLGLRSGRAYRMAVSFRWYDEDGERIRSERHRSRACREPAPNLRVAKVVARSGPVNGTAVYRVHVANTGVSEARDFGVTFAVDGGELDAARVESLPAGETRIVSFTGPVCRHGFRAVVDPDDQIGETREDDNVRRGPCGELRVAARGR